MKDIGLRGVSLRTALLADAVASGAMGLVLLAAGGALAGPLGLPAALLATAGAAFLPWAGFVGWLGVARQPLPGLVRAAAVLNAGYVVLSAAAVPLLAPTPLGIAVIVAQAVTVGAFAALQWQGVARAAAA